MQIAAHYLADIKQEGGHSHTWLYALSFVKKIISKTLGEKVNLVDWVMRL